MLGLSLVASPAVAAPVTLEGLTFSDEEGGFVILEGRGRGTPEDPFVLVEEIYAEERPAVLTVRGLRRGFGNRAGGDAAVGFVLVKIVRNRTSRVWTSFEMELREIKSRPSPLEDGLSFAQAAGPARLYRADRFREAWQTDEPLDAVTFYGGEVAPGDSVTFRVVITDYSPAWQFYLIQRRFVPLAGTEQRAPRLARSQLGAPSGRGRRADQPAEPLIQPAPALIDGIEGQIMVDAFIGHRPVGEIVQHPTPSVVLHHQNRMGDTPTLVLHHQHPQPLRGEAQQPQGDVFEDREILAVPGAGQELEG